MSQLRSDGIDTVFDKWDLTEGNDTNAFMEQCANDPCITNVLMLLDPIYAKKADGPLYTDRGVEYETFRYGAPSLYHTLTAGNPLRRHLPCSGGRRLLSLSWYQHSPLTVSQSK